MADEDLADKGLANGAQDRLALVSQANQGGPDRKTGHKGTGAVDRVQDPDKLGIRTIFAIFLADHPMVGDPVGKQGADGPFSPLVRLGHGIEPATLGKLVLKPVVGPKQGQDDLGSGSVQLDEQVVKRGKAVGSEHALTLPRRPPLWYPPGPTETLGNMRLRPLRVRR